MTPSAPKTQSTNPPASWSWWRGPANTGAAIGSSISAKNAASLKLAWKANLASAAYGTPAISGDVVVASALNSVSAYDARSGALLWTFSSPEGYQLFSGPTIVGDEAIVSTAYYGAATYALSLDSGKLLWERNWGAAYSAYGGAFPMSVNEIAIGLANQTEPVCSHGALVALNAQTGATIWEHDTASEGVGDGIWSAANADGKGDLVATTGNSCETPSASDEPDSVIAVDPVSGTERWRFFATDSQNDPANTDLDFGSTPVDANGILVTASKSGRVYGINENSGVQTFDVQITPASCCPETGGSISSPAWDGTRLYLGGGDANGTGAGRFVAMSPAGTILWNYSSGKPVQSPPSIANDVVFVGSTDDLVALDSATGRVLWKYATGDYIWAGSAVMGGQVFTTSTDGYVYAFTL